MLCAPFSFTSKYRLAVPNGVCRTRRPRRGSQLEGRHHDWISGEPQVRTLLLPGIGYLLQWRSDGFWREVNDVQHRDEAAGVFVPGEHEWTAWTGFARPHARGGEWDGVAAWWMVYGELPGEQAPDVVLTAGTRPPVQVLGRVWACEWHAVAQPATVHLQGQQFVLPFAEPAYRGHGSDTVRGPGWFRQ